MRPFALQQKRGVILTADNAADVSNFTYPKHHNAHHVAKHQTKTALELSRLGERRGAGAAIGERYIASHDPVPEPVPPNHETHPRMCEISHIRQRAEADHQLARTRGGLCPMNAYINPERECRSMGLGYDPAPPMATRSQLLETRKEGMRRECEELRTKCDSIQVPLSVRRAEKEVIELEFRRGGDHNQTLTKLKDQRRRDKIEYDMARFDHKAKVYPRFSDRPDIPFWVDHEQESAAPPPPVMPRMMSEPVFKITEIPFGDDIKDSHQTLPDSAYNTAAGLPPRNDMTKSGAETSKNTIGSRTKKSFCAEQIARGHARNMPRLFDAIQPLQTGPRDMESLDVTSSLAPIRDNALKKNAEMRKRNAESIKRSVLWSDPSQTASAPSQVERGMGSTEMGVSMDGMNSMDQTRRSQAPRASTMQAIARVNYVAADSTRRDAAATSIDAAREPKFFGSTPAPITRSYSEADVRVGVRCGGFQRLDWPSQHSMGGTKPAAEKGGKGSRGMSREKLSKDHSTSTGTVQPL